jgi:exoribonuclease II
VSIGDAARSAVQEGAEALLVDVAGPTTFVVETAELHELAAGRVLTPTAAGYAWLSGIARQM